MLIPQQILIELLLGQSFKCRFIFDKIGSHLPVKEYIIRSTIYRYRMQLIHILEQHLGQITVLHNFHKYFDLPLLRVLFYLVVDVFLKVLVAADVVLDEEDHALDN